MYIYSTDFSPYVLNQYLWNWQALRLLYCETSMQNSESSSPSPSQLPYPSAPNIPLSPNIDYSSIPPSQIPTTKKGDSNITVEGNMWSITPSGQRRLDWKGRKGLDLLINQRPDRAGLLLSKYVWGAGQIGLRPPSLCIILGLYPLPYMKLPHSVYQKFSKCALCEDQL